MKKLLVAAIGAAAAIGAFADTPEPITKLRFEDATVGDTNTVSQLDTLHDGTYWSDTGSADNTYVIESAGSVTSPKPLGNVTKALNVKTKFGNPLSVNVVSGGTTTNIPSSGLYFDSLVKFTVCDDCPTNQYDGAKIVLWLQEDEDLHKTNLYVNAGFLSCDNQGRIAVSNAIYKCGTTIGPDFADNWHRVTIKAIANITTSTRISVPGFAIFIDGLGTEVEYPAACTAAKWDESFTSQYEFAEAVEELKANSLFPSLIQGADGLLLSKASFDGTGSITDIAFYDESPAAFADDYVSQKATVTIGQLVQPFTSLASAVDYVNDLQSGNVTFALSRGMTLSEPLAFAAKANVNVVFDFAGCVLTNNVADMPAITNGGILTITNSNDSVGGIECTGLATTALSDSGNGRLTITAGNFKGHIILDEEGSYSFTGGAFLHDDDFDDYLSAIPAGKMLKQNQETGMWEIVPATYTITFISGEGSATNKYEDCTYEQVINVPTPAVVVGKTFSAWSPAIDGATVTATADATYTAVYETIKVNVIFVDGDTATTNKVDYGTTLTAESAPAFVGRAGYTAAWDKTVAGTTVTAETIFTAQYTAIEYTIAYKNADGTAFTAWDSEASPTTSYTIADAVTLPTASDLDLGVLGVEFKGWTNETGTVTGWAAGATGDVTVYAKLETTGSSGYDGGDGSTFTVDAGAVATVEAKTGAKMTDTVAGKGMTYAQAYALGLVDEGTGDVADLETTIEIKDGKVVVGLSEEAKEAYTITLKVYEKSSLTADWPVNPTQTITLGTPAAAAGFNPGSAASGFYKTEVSISNRE